MAELSFRRTAGGAPLTGNALRSRDADDPLSELSDADPGDDCFSITLRPAPPAAAPVITERASRPGCNRRQLPPPRLTGPPRPRAALLRGRPPRGQGSAANALAGRRLQPRCIRSLQPASAHRSTDHAAFRRVARWRAPVARFQKAPRSPCVRQIVICDTAKVRGWSWTAGRGDCARDPTSRGTRCAALFSRETVPCHE
jgi:hypothetical protein